MVHEISEYQRKFRWNSPQKRYQIWKENWNIRKNLKLLEFHHEPFIWEDDQSSNSSSTETIENNLLPPSKLKQKYLNLKKLTKNSSKCTVDKAASPERISPSSEMQISEKERIDIGVQTPDWFQSEKQNIQLQDKDLQEISRRLKEGVIYNINTLQFVDQISEKKESSSPPLKKQIMQKGDNVPRDNHQKFQTKPPFSLYGRANKARELANKHTFNVKSSKNVYPSDVKTYKKKLNENPKSFKQTKSENRQEVYKQEGHRIINDLSSAAQWLADYDNKCRYGIKNTFSHHTKI